MCPYSVYCVTVWWAWLVELACISIITSPFAPKIFSGLDKIFLMQCLIMSLLLLTIIFMAACSFCSKSFTNSAVAKQHEKKDCNQAHLGVSAAFKRRRARLEAANNALIRRNSKNSSKDIDKVGFHTDRYKKKLIFFIFTGRSHLYHTWNRCRSFPRAICVTAFTSLISISRWLPDFATISRLFGWFYNGNITKSIEDLNDLVVHVLLAPGFERI